MTTEDIITHIFCDVDEKLNGTSKAPGERLWPSEVVTIGILFALKGGHFRAFYRWLKRDFACLFGKDGEPFRTTVARQMRAYQHYTDVFLSQPTVLNVVDSYPIELIFPIREGRSKQQYGRKSKDKGRWTVGVKRCWVLNQVGHGCAWIWDPLNRPDQDFLPFLAEYDEEAIILADWGFRWADGLPDNVKLCKKGTWHDRMMVETSFSLLTVVCQAKKIFHRAEAYIETRLAYTVAMFNVCLALFHRLHPDQPPFKMSIAEFSL